MTLTCINVCHVVNLLARQIIKTRLGSDEFFNDLTK